jgi:autotransporter-associated beta strand protein
MRRTFAFRLFAYCAIVLVAHPRLAFGARSAGIDVSNNNGFINWTQVRSAGKDFAWAKATEGTTFTDSYFNGSSEHNMDSGTSAGLLMGAYHYAHPESNTATSEAAHFVAVAGPYLTTGYLRPMLDIEGTSFGLSTTDLSNWINTFCTYVTDRYGAGADPLIYISGSPAGSEVNSSVTIHGLDVAQYPTTADDPPVPTGNPSSTGVWSDWNFWQYSSKGTAATVPGVSSHYVDLDVAHGDINYVQSLTIGGTAPPTAFERFDVNGATAGSGVAANGSYTWETAQFSSTAAGTDAVAWNEGNFLRLAAGTDASTSNYTITANSNHTFAGMYLQSSGGGTVTITGSGILTLAAGDQGMYVDDQTSNLKVSAVIAGTGRLVWQGPAASGASGGSLYLLGANTYSGGTLLNTSKGLNFNNNSSFGTGRITWGVAQQVIAAPSAAGPITIANAWTTRAASSLVMASFAQPVTFSGAWTLDTGVSTFDVRSSADATISGNISGTDGTSALTKIQTGKLTLSGANTYAGATTISAGTLQLGSGGTGGKLSAAGTIVNNASLVFNQTDAVTQGSDFSTAAISGTGTVTQAGTGSLIFTAANTYTGATTISAGTLQLGNGGTTGKIATSSTIINNGNFAFNRTNTVTQGTDFSGSAISGSGNVTQSGTGTLVLNATNTYSGKTFINAGTLSVGADANLGAAPGSAVTDKLTINGGTFKNSAPFTLNSNRGITLGAGGGTFDTSSGALTFNGIVTGLGALNKSGANALNLAGANNYAGGTNLNAGTISLSGAAAHLGTGNVSVLGASAGTSLVIQGDVADAIQDSAMLSLAGGGTAGVADQGFVDLGAGIDELISSLILGAATQAPGLTYGSSASGAAVQSDEFFSGTGMLSVGLLGDFNDDGSVDDGDYLMWRKSDGALGGNAGYDLWRSNFGATAPASGSSDSLSHAAVPEPGAMILALVAGAAIMLRGRRREDSRATF